MRIELTVEQENQVTRIAAEEGRDVREVARDLFSRFLSQESRFVAAVKLGEAELDAGDLVTHEDVGGRVRRLREA
jgi:predicted transcriptional regulator